MCLSFASGNIYDAADGDALHITDAAADLDATECCALSWLLLKQSMMLQPGAAYFCCFECCRVLDSVLAKYDAATEGRSGDAGVLSDKVRWLAPAAAAARAECVNEDIPFFFIRKNCRFNAVFQLCCWEGGYYVGDQLFLWIFAVLH